MVAGLEGIAMPPVTSPKLHATIWQSGSNPVTASSFLPSPKRSARAWQRIPVPSVTRPCKIWKRTVGEPGTGTASTRYAQSLAELESQGAGARKRARKARHVPVWGETQWDVRAEEPRDGKWDLLEARATVAAMKEEHDERDERDERDEHEPQAILERRATFPEDKLRFVPRKRHNSRWPIEPTTMPETTMMVAELQPLVEYQVPTASIDTAEAQHSPQRATDKQMRRRSTRRLSRRVSLAHIEDTAVYQSPMGPMGRRISMAPVSPGKPSPIKKVAASPQKSFTLLASPTKVLFSPSPSKARSPTKSLQLPPPSPIVEAPEPEALSVLSEASSVLVFEQPVAEVQAEPAHETARRVSLRNAMRLEHNPPRGRRSLDFGTVQQPAPDRRHSFMPPQSGNGSAENKSRRHTLDVFGDSANVATEMEQDEETTTGFSSAETTENISEVVVDVCANLDIFGTKSGVTRRRKGRHASAHSDGQGDAASSPPSSIHYSSQGVDDSPLPIGLGIITRETGDGAIDSPDQAAPTLDTSFNSHSDDEDVEAETANQDFWLDDGIGSTPNERLNETVAEDEEAQQDGDGMFAPHDPEGLSTIFEDEEASYAPSSPLSRVASGEELEEGYKSSPSLASRGRRSTEAGSLSPTTTAEVDEHIPASPVAETKVADDLEDEDRRADEVDDGKMEQSFDFTLDTNEAVQLDETVEADAVISTTERPEDTKEQQNSSSPLSVRSFRGEECDMDGTMVVDDFSPHEPTEVVRGVSSEPRQDGGTMIVEDFSVHEPADEAQGESNTNQQDDVSERGDADNGSATYTPRYLVEVPSSPAPNVEQEAAQSSTPPQASITCLGEAGAAVDAAEKVLDTPPSKGLTPINSDRISPPAQQSPSSTKDDVVEDGDQEDEGDDDLQDEDMALALDYEPTVPISLDNDDETVTVEEAEAASEEPPDAEPAVPALLQEEDDSETEMLRRFVTRVSAGKSAKAAAAALALAARRNNLRPTTTKRRSGSTGSITTSSTGSPVASGKSSESAAAAAAEAAAAEATAAEAAAAAPKAMMVAPSVSSSSDATSTEQPPKKPRFPLGEKDANSPSPTKKRKASAGGGGKTTISSGGGKMSSDDLFRGNPALYSAEISPPKSKRLRSRRRAETETTGTGTGTDNASASATTTDSQAAASASDQQPSSSQQQQDMDTSMDSSNGGTGTGTGPRRSTRSKKKNSRGLVQLKSAAPSANSIALSLIPVRLPGSGSGSGSSSSGMMILNAADTSADKDMPTPVIVSRTARTTTAEEKDLAAVTRVNTRKNKGGAMPPKVIISRQAEDPLGFKLRELKGVFDAKEGREGGEAFVAAPEKEQQQHQQENEDPNCNSNGNSKDGRKSRKGGGKGVRWASELVRFNTDFEPQSPTTTNRANRQQVVAMLPPSRKGAARTPTPVVVQQQQQQQLPTEEDGDGYFPHFPSVAADEASAVEQQQPTTSSSITDEEKQGVTFSEQPATTVQEEKEPEQQQQSKPAQPPTRRTRQSRLQMPTPISKKMLSSSASESSGAATGPVTPGTIVSGTTGAIGTVVSGGSKVPSASVVKMATRRTKIASLGMGVNGTPAPKRRTRA